jgi:hypothetical protein
MGGGIPQLRTIGSFEHPALGAKLNPQSRAQGFWNESTSYRHKPSHSIRD